MEISVFVLLTVQCARAMEDMVDLFGVEYDYFIEQRVLKVISET